MPKMYDPTTMTVTEEFDDIAWCDRCGAAVYWGDCYAADGARGRTLFNATNMRKHVCPDLDDNDFDVVPE